MLTSGLFHHLASIVVYSVQRSEEFHSGMGRDGIEVQSRDPGIFRDGISLIFSSRDFLEIVRDFSGLTFFDAISDYLDCILFAKVVPKGWNCLDS